MAKLGTTAVGRKFKNTSWVTLKELNENQVEFTVYDYEARKFQDFVDKRKEIDGYTLKIRIDAVRRINPSIFKGQEYKVDVKCSTESSATYWDEIVETLASLINENDALEGCYAEKNSFTVKKTGEEIVYYRLSDTPQWNEDDDPYEGEDHPF